MAKTKEPSVQDSLKTFNDVIKRIGVESMQMQDHNVLCTTNKKQNVLIRVDNELWNTIMESELKEKITEIDPCNKGLISLASIPSNDNGVWIEINGEEFQSGKLIEINLDGYDYKISISKDNLILKLRKSELTDIAYQINTFTMIESGVVNKILKLRKRFVGTVENSSFDVMTAFIIV